MTDLDLSQVRADAQEARETVPRSEKLSDLSEKCGQQLELENQVEMIEKELKDTKEKLNRLSQVDIPDLMHELGVSNFTLTNGLKVQVSPFYGAKISEENSERAFNWLEDHGHEGIIKGELIIMYKRTDKQRLGQFFDLARELGFLTKDKLSVHPMTLKAFVKEQLTESNELPRELFGVYTGWQTKISKR